MSNPTNTDIMRELSGLRDSLDGIRGYADGIKTEVDGIRVEVRAHEDKLADYHKRIEGLESMREVVLDLNGRVSKIQEDATVMRQILDGTNTTIRDVMRSAVREIAQDARHALRDEVKRFADDLTDKINCLGCASGHEAKKPGEAG